MLQLEVLNPGGAALGPGELIGPLGDDAQPEVLQHRQQVRDRHRLAEPCDLQVQPRRDLLTRAMQTEAQGERLCAQRLQIRDVFERSARVNLFLVSQREHPPVVLCDGQACGFSSFPDQHLAQTIGPRRGGLGDALLDGRKVDLATTLRIRSHDRMQPGVNGPRDLDMRLDALAVEFVAHDLLDPLPHFGTVTITRHVDQARVEAVVRIATRQYSDRPPLVKINDTAHDADEVIHIGLEQLIARIGFQYVQNGLAVVAVGIDSEVLDDFLDLATQNRDVARASIVGARSPQAEKPMLAGHTPAGVECLDSDVVEVLAAMDGGNRVRFGDVQNATVASPCAHIATQCRDARFSSVGASGAAAGVAQDTQARLRVGQQPILRRTALEVVVAVAEKYEVPFLHPGEQVTGFA